MPKESPFHHSDFINAKLLGNVNTSFYMFYVFLTLNTKLSLQVSEFRKLLAVGRQQQLQRLEGSAFAQPQQPLKLEEQLNYRAAAAAAKAEREE